eukprot:3919030-Rhodomonas_salina.1
MEWAAVHSKAQESIEEIRKRLKRELDDRDSEHLRKALESSRNEFGRLKHTFKAALLKNPLRIPLWGAVSTHPDTIAVDCLGTAAVESLLPEPLHQHIT